MSSFGTKAKNRKTGEVVNVFCCDDYFGRHNYGYKIEGTDLFLTEELFLKHYERIDAWLRPNI